jgi:putative phosphoribosyl transferase
VVAAPVASPSASKALADEADEVVSAWRPTAFTAVGQAYVDFSPTSDADVRRLLNP